MLPARNPRQEKRFRWSLMTPPLRSRPQGCERRRRGYLNPPTRPKIRIPRRKPLIQAEGESVERSDRSFCLPSNKRHNDHNPHQARPPQKVDRGDNMTPPLKKGTQSTIPCPQYISLTDELGKYITQDTALVGKLGWEKFIMEKQGRG